MTRIALLGLALWGCSARPAAPVDPTLPEANAEIPDLRPRQILMDGAENLDPSTRAMALSWLVRLDEAPAGGTWGPRCLYDPSAWVQRAGVFALADRLSETDTRVLLEEYISQGHADPYVRGMAGLRLAGVGSPSAAATLSGAWRDTSESWQVAPLALASAAHGDPDALEALAEAVRSGEIAMELDFLRDLGASGHADLLPALQEGARFAEDEIRLPIAVALVELGDPSAEQVLRKALQHTDTDIRLGAVDLLVELDHPTANALLQRARNDSSDLLRWYARLALSARTGSDPESFEKAFQEVDPEVRALAVRLSAVAAAHPVAGSNKRVPRAAERLAAVGLDDPATAVRLEAVRAAAALGLDNQANHVATLTRDAWVQLRIEAAGAALSLGYTWPNYPAP